jgi:tripartite-type tricarboxylate transporter receptor subunit TctC
MVGDVDVVFLTNPSFAPKSVDQVVQYARENPGQLRFAINSLGSLHHLLTEQFIASNKLEVTRVPYKGAGQAVMDLLAGVTNVQIEGLPAAVAHVRSGKLNALAVASAKRIDALPDTPTFDELGMKGLVAAPWYALLAPAGTPQEIVARLNFELNKALARQSVQEAFAKQGARVIPTTPDEAGRFIRSETDRWAKVVTESGVKID